MSRILITGVTGFLGRAISREMTGNGNIVFGSASPFRSVEAPSDLEEVVRVDMNSDSFIAFLEKAAPDVVIHCAGSSSVGKSIDDPATDFAGNVELTRCLLEALRQHSKEARFVLLSSAAVYGNPATLPISESAEVKPISPYGFHKRQAELLVEEYSGVYGMATASLRIFSAYGPGLERQVLWDLSRKIAAGDAVEMHGDGTESRDFIHSADVARAVSLVSRKAPMNGEAYNLATGEEWTIRQLLEMLLEEFGVDRTVRYSGEVGDGVPRRWRADVSRLREMGFASEISLPDGAKDYVRWFSNTYG